MAEALKIGIAGLGTVGQAVAKQLLSGEVDARLQLVCVTAKQRARQRAIDLSSITWLDDPLAMAEADIDVVLELIGGADGVALELTQAALKAGKHVITANKAMLATHGTQLASLAEKQKLNLAYEAAVAGGIPVIKTLREGLAGNKIERICGILNGTCNFILSEMQASAMQSKGASFDDTLAKAQTLGYAESDPTFDISGVDAAQKLAILSSLAFGVQPDFTQVQTSGIGDISADDIQFSDEFNCVIRLIGLATKTDEGILQWVGTCLIRKGTPLAAIENVTNGVLIDADMVGQIMLQGPGAGGAATASAVLADLYDLLASRGQKYEPIFGRAAEQLVPPSSKITLPASQWYLRLVLVDAPGSLAKVTAILAEHGVSIEEIIQHKATDNQPANNQQDEAARPVIFITHNVPSQAIASACKQLQVADLIDKVVDSEICAMPILDNM